jgi:hypothetical protein
MLKGIGITALLAAVVVIVMMPSAQATPSIPPPAVAPRTASVTLAVDQFAYLALDSLSYHWHITVDDIANGHLTDDWQPKLYGSISACGNFPMRIKVPKTVVLTQPGVANSYTVAATVNLTPGTHSAPPYGGSEGGDLFWYENLDKGHHDVAHGDAMTLTLSLPTHTWGPADHWGDYVGSLTIEMAAR